MVNRGMMIRDVIKRYQSRDRSSMSRSAMPRSIESRR
jgi:hypothetical protein